MPYSIRVNKMEKWHGIRIWNRNPQQIFYYVIDPWGDGHPKCETQWWGKPPFLCKISAKSVQQFRRRCVPSRHTQTSSKQLSNYYHGETITRKKNYHVIWIWCSMHSQLYNSQHSILFHRVQRKIKVIECKNILGRPNLWIGVGLLS